MNKIVGKKKLFLYSMSAIGLNLMNLIVATFLCDALMVEGFQVEVENWTYASKTLIVAGVWSAMIFVAKVLDGVIDIPLAALTDKLESKWGRRRPPILVGLVLAIVTYLGLLAIPIDAEHSMFNTVYYGIMLCLFYAAYTLTLVTYYATFSEITDGHEGRIHLSNFKTIFDVLYFVLGYALIPALIGSMNIRIIALMFAPLALTMVIPLFMIKERSTRPEDAIPSSGEGDLQNEKTVGIYESVAYLMKNRPFLVWMLVYSVLQFGVQMFLTAQNVYYSSVMDLTGMQITMLMALVFLPIPFTMLFYSHTIKKKGLIAGYRYSLLLYLASMMVMFFCRAEWMPNTTLRMVMAAVSAVLSAFGIGCFFSINYSVPSAIAAEERKETGISHPAMFFAVQGLAGGVATGVSTGIIWVNLKNMQNGDLVWIMPIFVTVSGLISYAITYFLPAKIRHLGKE